MVNLERSMTELEVKYIMPLTRRFYISATSFQAFTEKGHRHSYARILAYKHMHTCTHTNTHYRSSSPEMFQKITALKL